MKSQFIPLTTSLFILLSPAFSATCNIPSIEEKRFLSMSYEDFDQKSHGWRQYAKLGCYHDAGILIDKYLSKKKAILADWQIIGIT